MHSLHLRTAGVTRSLLVEGMLAKQRQGSVSRFTSSTVSTSCCRGIENPLEHAQCTPQEERKLLKHFKGIGDVGADIFFRQVQLAWDELYPFAEDRALRVAARLGLGHTVANVASLIEKRDLRRLLEALVRLDLEKRGAEVVGRGG